MGYCTETDITRTIAQALTTATASTSDDLGTYSSLLNVGNTLDKNLVTTANVNYYIQLADSEIDGVLSQLYSTPFCENVDFDKIAILPYYLTIYLLSSLQSIYKLSYTFSLNNHYLICLRPFSIVPPVGNAY